MTVKRLKEILATCPDDYDVLIQVGGIDVQVPDKVWKGVNHKHITITAENLTKEVR